MTMMMMTMVILMFFHHIERARFRLVLRKVTDYKHQMYAKSNRELQLANTVIPMPHKRSQSEGTDRGRP